MLEKPNFDDLFHAAYFEFGTSGQRPHFKGFSRESTYPYALG
jgi:hypothetical protein